MKAIPLKILLLPLLITLFATAEARAQVVVIANKSAPVDTLSKTQLVDFYTGDIKKWQNGERALIKDLKPNNETKEMFYKYLGKSSSRMKSIWLKKMLSGEGDPPEALDSEEEMLQKVASTPGAIGFINSVKLNGEVKALILIADHSGN